MSTPEERVAHRMREARKRTGISQEATADRLGITLRTYARWERGESLGYVGHIAAIAKALETTPDDLLGGENLTGPTVEELSDKLDAVMAELRALREDLAPAKGRSRAR